MVMGWEEGFENYWKDLETFMKQNLNSLIGMTRLRTMSRLYISACIKSRRIFPHLLLSGLGGTGKTALARAICNELDYHYVEVLGSVFKSFDDISEFIIKCSEEALRLQKSLLLFIDEVHQLRVNFQESLYLPMKEYRVSTLSGYKKIAPFTLFAATTRFDMLDSNSFITRFPNRWELVRYSESDIACIVANYFRTKGLKFNKEVTRSIAQRSLGIPRNAISLSEKIELVVLGEGLCDVSLVHVNKIFRLEELDHLGLSSVHLRYMRILDESRDSVGNHCPIGIGAISSKMRQNERVIGGSVEPILFEFSFVSPTSRGRKITFQGVEYLRSCTVR